MARVNWKPAFLAALATVPVIDQACRAVGISRGTVYKARKADATLAAAWDDALEAGIDNAEIEVFKRAVDGYEEPLVHNGQLMHRTTRRVDADGTEHWDVVLDDHGQPVPLTIRKYSDALLALIMKGRRKRIYSDRVELADASPLDPPDELNRTARISQLLAVAKARADDQAPGDLARPRISCRDPTSITSTVVISGNDQDPLRRHHRDQ